MEKLKLQSPWVVWTNKVREMFKRDPEIMMTWSDETLILKMYIQDPVKAAAIKAILPSTKTWGKNTVKVEIIPAYVEDLVFDVDEVTINDAFQGNPLFHYTKTFYDVFLTGPLTYVVFAKEVIQWFQDDLSDLFCNENMLAEDIARDIFEDAHGVCFCTDVK